MSSKKHVAVAMSGGVDSSVAACLLKEQGYQVTGVTMKLWDSGTEGPLNEKSCCTLDSSLDAKRVCDSLEIPHYTLDMTREFKSLVVDPFYEEYKKVRTPNPCVNCNSFVKWGALWEKVRLVGADLLATGHYADTGELNGAKVLIRGADLNKDQSYFLWGIPSDLLERTLFPLAGIEKPEVRKIAAKYKLRTAEKRESQDICFIPDGDKNRFLKEQALQAGDSFQPGPVIGPDGKVLGEHPGLSFFTLGQRKGLGVATGEPLFVKEMNRETNTLVLGRSGDLSTGSFMCTKSNWYFDDFETLEDLSVQVRYRAKPISCKIKREEKDVFKVEMSEKVRSVTPGQSAVFYQNRALVGGALIV